MPHVVLLGDSIFDNAPYVGDGPTVVTQLRRLLPRDWSATLLAADGAVTADVARQLRRLPADATHLVVSAGGCDALECTGLLYQPDRPAGAVLAELAAARQKLLDDYAAMLAAAAATGLPVGVCAVYDGFPGMTPEGATALAAFNDVILRSAAAAGVPVVDLRLVCDEGRDFSAASPIEPSVVGGFKIAGAVARLVTSHDFAGRRCVVYGK